MRNFYYPAIAALALLPYSISAQHNSYSKGSVTFRLDNSKNNNKPIDAVYIILDRFDLTGAGVVKERYDAVDNKISFQDLPVGEYYADIFTKGLYEQHFFKVITVSKKGKTYSFKLSEVELYDSGTIVIPQESDDYSKTSVVLMK